MFRWKSTLGGASALLTAGLFIGAQPASAQNLIVNGSFETPDIGNGPPGFVAVPPPGSIPGWVVGGGGVDIINDVSWLADDGDQSIDLSNLTAGSLSQTVTTVIGQQYTFSFAMMGNFYGGDVIKDMTVQFGSQALPNQSFDTTGSSRFNPNWSTRNFLVTATSVSTTITFTSLENNEYGPALDDVQLVPVGPSNVAPEPASLALLGIGLAGVALRRRTRA